VYVHKLKNDELAATEIGHLSDLALIRRGNAVDPGTRRSCLQ
jgi:hypothetical protein